MILKLTNIPRGLVWNSARCSPRAESVISNPAGELIVQQVLIERILLRSVSGGSFDVGSDEYHWWPLPASHGDRTNTEGLRFVESPPSVTHIPGDLVTVFASVGAA